MSEYGKQKHDGEREQGRVGHETDAEFAEMMDGRGEADGAAGVSDALTIGRDASPLRIAKEATRARIGKLKGWMAKKRRPLRRVVGEGPARVRQKLADSALHANSVVELKERLHECRVDIPYFAEARERIEASIAEIPFYRRGLVSAGVLGGVLTGVAAFDGAVMKSALDQTALDETSIWFTTGGIAVLFMAINEAFGLLLGVLVRRAGRRRVWMLAGALIVGLIGLFASVAMLGWFRHEVALSQNHSLSAIAAGKEASFDFIIDPLFLAPLQGAGCIAAMSVVALYALSSDWRVLDRRLKEVKAQIKQNDDDIVAIERELVVAQNASRTSFSESIGVEAEVAGANAELASIDEEEQAEVDAQRGLGGEMAARYENTRNVVKKMFENGEVKRAAAPTEFGRRSSRTPDARDIPDPRANRDRHKADFSGAREKKNGHGGNGNGHGGIDPEEMFFDVRGL